VGLSPESFKPVEADAVIAAEGSTEAPQRPGAEAPPGSEARARARRAFQEPGRSSALLAEEGDRDDSLNNDPARASRARELGSPFGRGDTKTGAQTRYRQAKATKRGGKERWKSEPPIVPMRMGNSTTRTQWREEAAEAESRTRER
jgi:hypothetical protein